jgi:hypothetical protein
MHWDRSKIVAILTGAIALILGIAYLTVVQLLDFRGEMIPAPESQISPPPIGILVGLQLPSATRLFW